MIQRFVRHLWCVYWQAPRIFTQRTRAVLADAITLAEIGHAGEICPVIEASLTPWQLWCGLSAHERAIEVFSRQRVWDTERNSGLLIYLLLADRAVEIVQIVAYAKRKSVAPGPICLALCAKRSAQGSSRQAVWAPLIPQAS